MKFTVLWTEEAEDELAEIWIAAADRTAITVAANQIDATLRNDATQQGESREGDEHILLAPPLGVLFKALAEDRIAYVFTVWRY
ncbi:MAG: hypothetical protein KY475_04960 [Planctomycetes bacterium]|nr:hypothetical protein [Planctomycetota bacterium]